MHCPEFILMSSRIAFVTLYADWDYVQFSRVPRIERYNPLRYEIIIAPFTRFRFVINRDGVAHRIVSNAAYRFRTMMAGKK